ncbi:tetratricopeptide repeat protein, partial [Pseudomonas corrugata]|uniref:tetratricopeptide repeat protein n=1 Tax=Pseudomonas corrugata TaxID=47879 RepID=UPI000A439101
GVECAAWLGLSQIFWPRYRIAPKFETPLSVRYWPISACCDRHEPARRGLSWWRVIYQDLLSSLAFFQNLVCALDRLQNSPMKHLSAPLKWTDRDCFSMAMNEATHEQLKAFCKLGDEYLDRCQYEEAVGQYNFAWDLIPEPKNDWHAATWVLAAIGDACFLGGFFVSAKEALQYAMTCPDAIGNPFLHLRLGQVLFETGELERAADELIRAYMGGADEIFANDDPKYLAFLKSRADI